jgi:hypothetical protein
MKSFSFNTLYLFRVSAFMTSLRNYTNFKANASVITSFFSAAALLLLWDAYYKALRTNT